MRKKLISGGYTVIMQGIYIFSNFFVFIIIIFLLNPSKIGIENWFFLITIILVSFLGIFRQLMFADIYKTGDQIIVKKITGNRRYLSSEIEVIDEGVFPYNYYVKFRNHKKVFFRLKSTDLLNRALEFGTGDTLAVIRHEFEN